MSRRNGSAFCRVRRVGSRRGDHIVLTSQLDVSFAAGESTLAVDRVVTAAAAAIYFRAESATPATGPAADPQTDCSIRDN